MIGSLWTWLPCGRFWWATGHQHDSISPLCYCRYSLNYLALKSIIQHSRLFKRSSRWTVCGSISFHMTLQSCCIILAFISEQLQLAVIIHLPVQWSIVFIQTHQQRCIKQHFQQWDGWWKKTSGELWVLEYGPAEIERNVTGPGEGISLFIKTDFLCMKENESHKTSVLFIQLQLCLFQHLSKWCLAKMHSSYIVSLDFVDV